jgi:hypothetical protein
LIFRTGYGSASFTFCRVISGVSMPMEKVVTGASTGSSPNSRWIGMPSRWPTQSRMAMSMAAFAAQCPSTRRRMSALSLSYFPGSAVLSRSFRPSTTFFPLSASSWYRMMGAPSPTPVIPSRV